MRQFQIFLIAFFLLTGCEPLPTRKFHGTIVRIDSAGYTKPAYVVVKPDVILEGSAMVQGPLIVINVDPVNILYVNETGTFEIPLQAYNETPVLVSFKAD